MHRIDGPGFAPGNLFTQGNPTTGVLPTQVTADWANAVQEELAYVITQAGIALNKADNTQLKAAILALIASIGYTTGDAKLTLKTVADSGWVLMNDGTIGNAASGGTTRANADCQALFTLIWNNVNNTNAPLQDSAGVPTARGASAAADWAANRRISLTKQLGRAIAVAGAGTGLTNRTLGDAMGAETHTLSISEMPAHDHSYTSYQGSATGNDGFSTRNNGDTSTSGNAHINDTGGGQAHNNMQPSAFWNVMIKL